RVMAAVIATSLQADYGDLRAIVRSLEGERSLTIDIGPRGGGGTTRPPDCYGVSPIVYLGPTGSVIQAELDDGCPITDDDGKRCAAWQSFPGYPKNGIGPGASSKTPWQARTLVRIPRLPGNGLSDVEELRKHVRRLADLMPTQCPGAWVVASMDRSWED